MTEPTDALIPCPFCGSPDVAIADDLVTFNGLCNACGASGGYSSYRNGATWLWNRRTPQPTQAQDVAPRVSPEQWQALFEDQKRLVELANSRAEIAERMLKATQAQAGAVPLTDERLVACIKAAGFKTWDSRMWALKREIEAAHGIKGGQHGAE